MIIYIISIAIALIAVKIWAAKQPMVLHGIVVCCYALGNPVTNKLQFAIVVVWMACLLIRKIRGRERFTLTSCALLLIVSGTWWLISGIIGLNQSQTIGMDAFSSAILSPYGNGVLWGIIIISTVREVGVLRRLCWIYVVVRFIELAVIGSIVYLVDFGWWDTVRELLPQLQWDYNVEQPRLISLGVRNACDSGFLLVSIIGFIFGRYYCKQNFKTGLMLFASLFALVLTWTRGAWLAFALQIMLLLCLKRRISKSFAAIMLIGVLLVTPFVGGYVYREAVAGSQMRLLSDASTNYRFQLYAQHLAVLPHVPMLHGLYEKYEFIGKKFGIYPSQSSENYLVDTFERHGWMAGILTVMTCLAFIYLCFANSRYANRYKLNLDDAAFIHALSATYLALFTLGLITMPLRVEVYWIFGAMLIAAHNALRHEQVSTEYS
ncbi:MAG: O-antigen ligase family protein [Prevotellaceae bacterium]|jgi:hypothetical protein|nr:O-antigen ligase family protein [Prevotellaceae bacterium]